MVYVLNKEGKAIMPTKRHGKVRKLLCGGKAHVVRLQPFTIQLDYDSKNYTQDISLGIDAGSVHIGISATTRKEELFAAEVIMRTDIVEKLASRLELRKTRRYNKTRYRKAKFSNRRKEKDWLAPSIRNKIDCHLKVIHLVHSLLPVTKTTIEVAQFDIQKMKNSVVQGVEYQQGEQLGFWNVREYILARDGHKCQHCKGKSGDKVLNIHHIESRKTGGNAPNNLITLCNTCHKAYHRGDIQIVAKRGFIFRNMTFMNVMRWNLYHRLQNIYTNVFLTYGYLTKYLRINNNIKKTHAADAFCISNNINAKRMSYCFVFRCKSRHIRSLHVQKPQKGGKRKRKAPKHWIDKTRFQKYDFVRFNSIKGFISSYTGDQVFIKDINWDLVYPKRITINKIKFIRRIKNGWLFTSLQTG